MTTESEAHEQLVADVFARDCTSRHLLEHVAGKWSILALRALDEEAYRFNALRRRVDGVSEKMLSQTLQALERDGLVHREVLETIPPRVEYTLTGIGRRVARSLAAFVDVVEDVAPTVHAAQQSYDAARSVRT